MKETLGSFRESSSCHGISSSVPSGLPSLLRAETSRSQAGLSGSRTSVSQIKHDFQGLPTLYPHSLPDYNDRLTNGVPCSSDRNILATDSSFSNEGFESTHFGRINSGIDVCNVMFVRLFIIEI